jgi:hypothetical protein
MSRPVFNITVLGDVHIHCASEPAGILKRIKTALQKLRTIMADNTTELETATTELETAVTVEAAEVEAIIEELKAQAVTPELIARIRAVTARVSNIVTPAPTVEPPAEPEPVV